MYIGGVCAAAAVVVATPCILSWSLKIDVVVVIVIGIADASHKRYTTKGGESDLAFLLFESVLKEHEHWNLGAVDFTIFA